MNATLVYVLSLPQDQRCEQAQDGDQNVYVCNGVIYRPTYYQDELVYEIVSPE